MTHGGARTSVVLPVKSLGRAKHRLAGVLAPAERSALMEAMLTDVLASLDGARGVHELVVVSSDPVATELGARAGGRITADPHERGHVEAAGLGVQAALAGGAERVLVVPGDCPLVSRSEIEALTRLPPAPGPRMVIVTDRARQGTNALLLEPPDALTPSFGLGSLSRHVATARTRGMAVEQPSVPGLEHDVDTPADLAALRGVLAGRRGAAPHTAALLDGLAPALHSVS